MLLIRDYLCEPPSLLSSVRDLTLFANVFRHHDVLLISDLPDIYWPWLKKFGCHDFFAAIVRENECVGIKIDSHPPASIIVDRIVPENLNYILKQI